MNLHRRSPTRSNLDCWFSNTPSTIDDLLFPLVNQTCSPISLNLNHRPLTIDRLFWQTNIVHKSHRTPIVDDQRNSRQPTCLQISSNLDRRRSTIVHLLASVATTLMWHDTWILMWQDNGCRHGNLANVAWHMDVDMAWHVITPFPFIDDQQLLLDELNTSPIFSTLDYRPLMIDDFPWTHETFRQLSLTLDHRSLSIDDFSCLIKTLFWFCRPDHLRFLLGEPNT